MADNKLMDFVEPRFVVWIAMAFPAAYALFDWGFSPWLVVAVSAVGIVFFEKNFIEKSLVKKTAQKELGPSEPFAGPTAETYVQERDPITGEFITRKEFRVPRTIKEMRR